MKFLLLSTLFMFSFATSFADDSIETFPTITDNGTELILDSEEGSSILLEETLSLSDKKPATNKLALSLKVRKDKVVKTAESLIENGKEVSARNIEMQMRHDMQTSRR